MQPASWSARVALVGALLTAGTLLPFATTPVSAADPARQLATVRAEVDRLGNQYFAARQRLHALDDELARLRTARAGIARSYAQQHRLAVRRAVARYTEGDMTPADQNPATSLNSATSSVLLEHAAATTTAAMDRFAR